MNKLFILGICKKLINFLRSLKKKLKDNFFILLGLFLFIFFILLTTNVKATDVSDDEITVIEPGVIREGNKYFIDYDYYDSKGHKTGRIRISEGMYTHKHWVLFTDENDNFYWVGSNEDSHPGNFYFNYFTGTNSFGESTSYIMFGKQAGTYEEGYYYKYDESSDKWSSVQCKKTHFRANSTVFNSSGIIKTRAMSVYYYNDKYYEYYHYSVPVVFPIIDNYSEVYSGSYEYIDILLNDCYDFGLLEDTLSDGKNIKRTYKINKFDIKFYNVETGDAIFTQTYSSINIDDASGFYMYIDDEEFYHLRFPRDLVYDENVEKGKEYAISLSFDFSVTTNIDNKFYTFTQRYIDEDIYQFTYGTPVIPDVPEEPSDTDKVINSFTNSIGEQTGAINNQTNAIKEQTEVNKNIFEKIGEMLSYINPFSENFFVYKLIELLLEMLKSLFIPSDNFFNDWLSDMNNYFSDRFGIIYYPFDLVIDFLTRVVDTCSNVSSNAVLSVPDLTFMGVTLIHSFTFDFNSLLVNDGLKTVYNIYLVVVDVILSLMLVNLAKNTFTEVFGGRFSDEIISDMTRSSKTTKNDKE